MFLHNDTVNPKGGWGQGDILSGEPEFLVTSLSLMIRFGIVTGSGYLTRQLTWTSYIL